ncbi:MAG TPA: hypothetical protein VN750_13730 [Steroidobacteraceae bacterium]|nr:hypothetical protein [Steroidobacteraceae bacterium]
MLRTARVSFAAALVLGALPVTAGAQETFVGPLSVPAIVAAPFSAVGITETTRQTADGNRFSHTSSVRFYRDSQGRTRIERQVSLPGSNANGEQSAASFIEIRDPVSNAYIILNPAHKTALINTAMHLTTSEPASTAPRLFAQFGGVRIGPNDRGWSAAVPLGEKSIDGLSALGTRQVYTIPAGSSRFGNQKAVTITVEQWYSRALGMILSRTGTASRGGQTSYHLEQIVQAEPDASLFTIPADYRNLSLPTRSMAAGAAVNAAK